MHNCSHLDGYMRVCYMISQLSPIYGLTIVTILYGYQL